MAYAAGYKVHFVPIQDKCKNQYTIDAEWYFQNEDIINKLKYVQERHEREKYQQYQALKAKLAELKEKYGFED